MYDMKGSFCLPWFDWELSRSNHDNDMYQLRAGISEDARKLIRTSHEDEPLNQKELITMSMFEEDKTPVCMCFFVHKLVIVKLKCYIKFRAELKCFVTFFFLI